MDAIANAEVPDTVLSMSKEQLAQYQLVPNLTHLQVPMDSANSRLRLNRHRHCFTFWKGECLTCRMSYPRQLAKRTYFSEIVSDPTTTNDLVPTRRFPNDDIGDEYIKVNHLCKVIIR